MQGARRGTRLQSQWKPSKRREIPFLNKTNLLSSSSTYMYNVDLRCCLWQKISSTKFSISHSSNVWKWETSSKHSMQAISQNHYYSDLRVGNSQLGLPFTRKGNSVATVPVPSMVKKDRMGWCGSLVKCLAYGGSQVRIALQLPRRDHGQVLHSHLPVTFRRVNSDNSDTVLML